MQLISLNYSKQNDPWLSNGSVREGPSQVSPISNSASHHHCYNQTKTKICSSPRGTYQVRRNEVLLSVMHPHPLWHGCRVAGWCHSVQPFTVVSPGKPWEDLVWGVRLSDCENQHQLSAKHLTACKNLAHSENNDLAHPVKLGVS